MIWRRVSEGEYSLVKVDGRDACVSCVIAIFGRLVVEVRYLCDMTLQLGKRAFQVVPTTKTRLAGESFRDAVDKCILSL